MRPVLCLITDRARQGTEWPVRIPAQVAAAARAGVQLIQVRERDLDGGPLEQLVRACVAAVSGTPARVLVNDRLDVALAAGAHGVHLRGDSLAAERVRAGGPRPFLVGRSVHSVDEARLAAAGGALDYLIFGTVFETGSKAGKAAAGLAALADVAHAVPVPVLAVGGVSAHRLASIQGTGAAGAAGIGMFSAFDTPGGVT